jgi:hypothetical protein
MSVKIQKIANEIERRKVLFYATATAQADKEAAVKEVRELDSKLTAEAAQQFIHDEDELYVTGAYLSRFQDIADEERKATAGDNQQLVVSRKMYLETFPMAKRKATEQLQKKYYASAREVIRAYGASSPEYQKNLDDLDKEMYCLSEAHNYARRDAREVLTKDMAENSKSVNNSISGVRTDYEKNHDGSFVVSTLFSVQGSNLKEAEERAKSSFKGDNAKLSISSCETPNTYNCIAQSKYTNEEKFEDVARIHKAGFNSTWAGKFDTRSYS